MPRTDMVRSLWQTAALLGCLVSPLPAQGNASSGDSLFSVVDGWVERGLVRYQVAGAALVIVRDGRIVHQAGFGLADVGRAYRVNADSTRFHIASITKLLTAIAAVQQVEAGKLTLHHDVRPMLGSVRASGWTRDSVTLHQLLTHTAGLDTRWTGMAANTPDGVKSLAEYVPGAMAPIIDRPGEIIRYSNMGYVAIGRLIEVASGQSWPQYIEQRVLAPLGMGHSYAVPRTPPPSHATPYRYRHDTLPEPPVFEHAAPSGAVHATATDLARLLVALMDSTNAVPVSAAGKSLLLSSQHRVGQGVRGYSYGTFDYPNARVQAVSFGGEVPGFSTRVLMVPSLQLGVVLMVNRKDPLLAIGVFDSLLTRLAPVRDTAHACAVTSAPAGMRAASITGQYRSNVYDRGSFLRVGALVGPMFKVESDTGQTLIVVNPIDNRAARWHAVSDSVWAGPEGTCMALVSTSSGPMLALSTKVAGPVMLERVTPLSNPAVVVSAALLASLVLGVLFILELRRMRRLAAITRPDGERVLGRLAACVSAAHWIFLPLFGLGLYKLAIKYDDRFAFGIPAWYSLTLLLPYLIAALTIGLAWLLVRSRGVRFTKQRWLVVASSALLLVVFWNWRMMWVP